MSERRVLNTVVFLQIYKEILPQ